jgi:hypothetical protein
MDRVCRKPAAEPDHFSNGSLTEKTATALVQLAMKTGSAIRHCSQNNFTLFFCVINSLLKYLSRAKENTFQFLQPCLARISHPGQPFYWLSHLHAGRYGQKIPPKKLIFSKRIGISL